MISRVEEINAKHQQLLQLLDHFKAEAIWLRKVRNVAWLTAGADAAISIEREQGAYSILVTPARRTIYTNNIEAPRLRQEEGLENLGFQMAEYPWHNQQIQTPIMAGMISDENPSIEEAVQRLRWVLNPSEQGRYRVLGRDAAEALDETLRTLQPGQSELEISARLHEACRKRGGLAIVNLIAADERINRYRHPVPTGKTLERYALLVLCMRRGGLVVAASRLAYLGKAPEQLQRKAQQVAYVDAAAILGSRAGRTLGQVLEAIQQAYAEIGVPDAWQHHHQGGLIAYQSREKLALPHSPLELVAGQACAWNPSLPGAKSEDTILITPNGYEIITPLPTDFPTVSITLGGQTIVRPGIVEL